MGRKEMKKFKNQSRRKHNGRKKEERERQRNRGKQIIGQKKIIRKCINKSCKAILYQLVIINAIEPYRT